MIRNRLALYNVDIKDGFSTAVEASRVPKTREEISYLVNYVFYIKPFLP